MSKVIKLADYKKETCKHNKYVLDCSVGSVLCENCGLYLNPVSILAKTIEDYNELTVEYERLRHAYMEIRGIIMAARKK